MSNAISDDEIIKFLRRISIALKDNDEPAICELIDLIGAELIFSENSIEWARAMRDVRLTVFLLSIAKENNIIGKKNNHWSIIYNSINKGVYPSQKIEYSTGLILKSIIEKKEILVEDFCESFLFPFNEYDMELAIDFRRWSFVLKVLGGLSTSESSLEHWLRLLKIIIKRQRFISNTNDGKNLAVVYKLIIEKLNGVQVFQRNLASINLMYANSLQISGDFQGALEIYEELEVSNNSIPVMLERARCHSKLGSYSNSIKQLDSLIFLLLDKYSRGESVPVLLQNSADINYSKDNAISAYVDIVSLAEMANAKLFMVSGTLLGYCRLSDFLPNDKDLDFGLIGLDSLAPLVNLALKSGLFQINPEYLKAEETIQVPFIHIPTGIWIDVFIYQDKGDKFVTGVDFQFGYRQNFEFSKFDPVQVDFYNFKTYIPSNFHENLSENFSNWREPDVNYISHLESPSVMDYGGVSHQMTSRFWLIRSIQSNSKEKFRKVMKVISDISTFNDGFSLDLIRYLSFYERKILN